MSVVEVVPRGPIRRTFNEIIRPNKLVVKVYPPMKIVETAIHDALGKMGWILVRTSVVMSETIMEFRKG